MPFRIIKLASLLSGSLLAGTVLASAGAFAQPISEYEEVHPIYHDKRSGETFYQIYDRDGTDGFSVIYADRQGQWSKLSDVSIMQYPYLFYKPYTNPFVYFDSDNPLLYNKRFMYDPSRKTLIDGQPYTMSPTGKSGYLMFNHYVPVRNTGEQGFTPRRSNTLFLKDMTSGTIHELWSGRGYIRTEFTNDGQLVVNIDNKVYITDPSTYKLKPIADGYSYYYSDTSDEVVISLMGSNKLLAYRVKDETTRIIGPNDPRPKNTNMNTGFPPKSWPVPNPSLEVDDLPVTPVSAEYEPEALLTLGGDYSGGMWKMSAALAFIGTDHKVYVPVEPFVERLGLQVHKEITTRNDTSSYRFKLSLQKHRLTLDDTNSRVVNYHLYAPLDTLKQLGMGDVAIDWKAPAIPIPLEAASDLD
ncbi:hypothetical protein [Paenibacillus kobensis]|uniref:hypothetical protein n=1 Tax=Paenibacillus kobensis TaxID=59841 RepID=UPI000FDBEC5E|nr:hypothetical protein [Paenibacillus kobensis]